MINIKQGDCLELMKEIPDKSIDMVLCDLPYGTQRKNGCKWDVIISFELLWKNYSRIIKDDGAIALFRYFICILLNELHIIFHFYFVFYFSRISFGKYRYHFYVIQWLIICLHKIRFCVFYPYPIIFIHL